MSKKLFLCFYFLLFTLILVGGFTFLVPKAHAQAINVATHTNVTPSTQYTTFKGVPVYRLHVANTGDAPDVITSLTPTPIGNVDDTTITLHFFNDVNNNGFVDQGDIALGASAAFASDNTKQAFNITDVTVPVSGSANILITADGLNVGNAEIFNLSFALGTDILMGTVAISNTGDFPIENASPLTASDTAPSLSITNGANDPAPKTATASETGVVVKQISITAAAVSDSIVSLAITPAGTENDATQISSTKFYIDSGTTPGVVDGFDILLAKMPATYTADNTKTIFTFLSPIQIPLSSTVNILYTYDLGAGVIGGNTLTARLVATTDAVAGSGIIVSSNSSTVSSTITIAQSITINNVSLTLFTDNPVSGIVNIGDSIRIDATITNTDNIANGDCTTAVPIETVDLTKYGGTASEPLLANTCNNGVADTWFIVFTVSDAGGSGIDVGAANASSQVMVTAKDSNNPGGVTLVSNSMANPVDTIAPTATSGCIGITGNNGLGGEFIIGDALSMTWDNSAGCDNNTDITNVSFDVADFLASSTVSGVDAFDVWSGTLSAMNISPQDDINNKISVIVTDDAGNITSTDNAGFYVVDTIAPGLARITSKTQGGLFPAHDSVLWYNYPGNTFEAYVQGDEPLSEVRVCVRSLIEGNPTATCSSGPGGNFDNPADYISQMAVGNAATFTGTTFSSIAGANPLVDMTGYSMNFEIIDAAGNVYATAFPSEAFVMVYNVNPLTMPGSVLGGTTTDWSTDIADFTDVTELTFQAVSGPQILGTLSFPGSVNLTNPATVTALQNFASNVQVGGGGTADGSAQIGVNAGALVALDQPADLSIYVPGTTSQPGMVVYNDAGLQCGVIANDATDADICGDTISGITWKPIPHALTFSTSGFSKFGADSIGPIVLTYGPADDSTDVAVDANLVLTFDQSIHHGTGNVVIKKASDNSIVETIDINGGQVMLDHNRVTIDPSANLLNNTAYYVQIDNGAITDVVGNPYVGIADTTTWSFITVAGSSPSHGGSSGSYIRLPTPPITSTIFEIQKVTKDLKFGMTDSDVKILQLFLIQQNKGPVALALASYGGTNYFGKLTRAALAEWQKANGIIPAAGYFGPKTRAKIKLLNL